MHIVTKFFLLISGCFLLVGCKKKIAIKVSAPLPLTKEIEARFYDIPIFINAVIEKAFLKESGSNLLVFVTSSTLDYVINFYQQEMECFGWQECGYVGSASEALLSFEKPNKFCIISIQVLSNEEMRITIGSDFKQR